MTIAECYLLRDFAASCFSDGRCRSELGEPGACHSASRMRRNRPNIHACSLRGCGLSLQMWHRANSFGTAAHSPATSPPRNSCKTLFSSYRPTGWMALTTAWFSRFPSSRFLSAKIACSRRSGNRDAHARPWTCSTKHGLLAPVPECSPFHRAAYVCGEAAADTVSRKAATAKE